jgi:hypothetical protein
MFAEPLPRQCPPGNATRLSATTEFYRVAKSSPVSESDFRSVRWLYPDRKVPDECIASGVSIFQRKNDIERILKLGRFKKGRVVKIALGPNAGLLLGTPGDNANSHHTWWPFEDFDILSCCEEDE